MKTLFAVLGISTAIGLAAPAYSDPSDASGDDTGFIGALQQVGIHFPNPAGAVGAGKSVCGCLNNGESGLELVHEVKVRNVGFTMEEASNFAMIAAKYYCPQQLSKS
jgi:predicted RNase H-like HicB family nuclease